jgi:hypothetical protein
MLSIHISKNIGLKVTTFSNPLRPFVIPAYTCYTIYVDMDHSINKSVIFKPKTRKFRAAKDTLLSFDL